MLPALRTTPAFNPTPTWARWIGSLQALPRSPSCAANSENCGIFGGLTSDYYYADCSNDGFWVAAEPGCEINGGTWCD